MKPYIEENCVFEFQGKKFEAGGAAVTDEFVIGYPKFETENIGAKGNLCDWHGNVIGKCEITARWKIFSGISSHMCQIVAYVAGRKYTGRGAGTNMIYRGKRAR